MTSNQNDEVRRLRLVSGYWYSPVSDYKEPMYSEYVEAKHYDALRAEVERLRAALEHYAVCDCWKHDQQVCDKCQRAADVAPTPPTYSEQQVREFCGYLSADLKVLHYTHPDTIWQSWRDYLAVSNPPPAAIPTSGAAETLEQHKVDPMKVTDEMVNRFLRWKLPRDFAPDCGISFDGRKPDQWNPSREWPVGTNLFTAAQARAMLEHVLGGETPAERKP